MGIKIDERTQILYGRHVIDAKAVAEDFETWEGACRMDTDAITSDAPEDELVLRDILDAPVEIVRDAGAGDLVLRARIARRDGEAKEYERPYTEINLTPTKGAVSGVRYLHDTVEMDSLLREATPTHAVLDNPVFGLKVRFDYNGK